MMLACILSVEYIQHIQRHLVSSLFLYLPLFHFPPPSLSPGSPFITFKKWAAQIKDNFESKFWIPLDEHEAAVKEGENSHYIHRLGIYKDTCGSSHKYTDYQLRPNFPVAMVVAPDLFTPSNAHIALKKTEELLLGPLGMKTLDPG